MPTIDNRSRIDGPWVVCRIRVPYADTDQMGNVYYANYLVYFEMGRSEYMRTLGKTYRSFEEEGYVAPVLEAHVEYKGRLFYDDLIEMKVAAEMVKRTRYKFHYEIRRMGEDKLLVSGYTVHGIVNLALGKPVSVPEALVDLVKSLPAYDSK